MDARTINNLGLADPSAETRKLIACSRDIVKPGVYRQSGGRLKKYHEPRFLLNERRIIEEQLQINSHQEYRKQTNESAARLPTTRKAQRAVDSGQARTVLKANTTCPHGRRRNQIGNGPRPVSTEGPGSQQG